MSSFRRGDSFGGRQVSVTSLDQGYQPEYLGDLQSVRALLFAGTGTSSYRTVSVDTGMRGQDDATRGLLAHDLRAHPRSASAHHGGPDRHLVQHLRAIAESDDGGSASGSFPPPTASTSSTGTPAPQPDFPVMSAAAQRAKRHSFRVLYMVAFLSSVGFSILLPSLWPRLHADGKSKVFYGVVLSSYCVGQIIGAVSLGTAAAKFGYRAALVGSLLVEFIGYVAYAVTPNPWVIMASRLVAGVGAGNISLSRAFIAQHVEPDRRAGALAGVTACQALGFVTGPLVASVIGITKVASGAYPLRFDVNTLPSDFAALLAVLNLLAVVMYFTENFEAAAALPVELKNAAAAARASSASTASSDDSTPLVSRTVPIAGLCLCASLFCIELLVFSLGETALVPLTVGFYGWDVAQNGAMWAAVSGTATVSFVLVRLTARYFASSVRMFAFGLTLGIVSLLALCPWSAVVPAVPMRLADHGGDSIAPWRLVTFMCLLMGVAHPFAFVGMMTTYSNLVPNGQQSRFMGYLQGAGSLGRIIGPVYSGQLLSLDAHNIGQGAFWLFAATAAILCTALAVLACFRSTTRRS